MIQRTQVQGVMEHPSVRVVAIILYAIVSYFLSMYAVAAIGSVTGLDSWFSTTVGVLVFRCATYTLTIALLFGWLRWGPHRVTLQSIGFGREMKWRDVGYGVVGFFGYGLLAMVVLFAVSHIPGFDTAQDQNVGIKGSLFGVERFIAFVVLVIIVPIAEELMFRGMLYGRLRQEHLPWWVSALIVSVLFGLAHGQWNVGVDVFCLSMIACGLRELTGTIWAGTLLHIIKNLIAFCYLFVFLSV